MRETVYFSYFDITVLSFVGECLTSKPEDGGLSSHPTFLTHKKMFTYIYFPFDLTQKQIF
jgi:hypothetical protein